MQIGRDHPKDIRFFLDNFQLSIATSVRDLGIIYSDCLEFDEYTEQIGRYAYVKSNHILRAFNTRNVKILFRVFTTYVRPILEYCTLIWLPSEKYQIDAIEKCKKSFCLDVSQDLGCIIFLTKNSSSGYATHRSCLGA